MRLNNVIFILGGRVAQFLIAFLSVKLMTSLLAPVEVGKITLIATETAFFALFFVYPVGMFINRRLHAWVVAGSVRHYFHLYGLYLGVVAVVAWLASWVLSTFNLINISVNPILVGFLVAGSIIFNTVNQTLVPSLNMINRVKPFVALTISTLAFGMVFSVVFVFSFGRSAQSWLLGPLLSQIIFSAITYRVFFDSKDNMRRPSPIPVRKLFSFCWPVAVAVGLSWLQMQGYRFILAEKFSLTDLGIFAAGYGLAASLIAAMESVFMTWFQPEFYRQSNSDDSVVRNQAWANYIETMLPLSILALSGIISTAPYLTKIMLGGNYQLASQYVIGGAVAEWIKMVANMLSLSSHQRMRTRALIMPSLIGAAATYMFLYVFLARNALDLVPLAAAVGGGLICALLYREATINNSEIKIAWSKILKCSIFSAGITFVFIEFVRPVIGKADYFGAISGVALASLIWMCTAWCFLRAIHLKR